MSITNRLKEKGFTFDLPVRYDGKGTYYHSIQPRISQVLDWLRTEKNIFIVVFIDDDTDNPVTYEIYKGTECVMYEHKYYSLSEWNHAEIDAIVHVLDKLL